MADDTCKGCGSVDPDPKTGFCHECASDRPEHGVIRLNGERPGRKETKADDTDYLEDDDEE